MVEKHDFGPKKCVLGPENTEKVPKKPKKIKFFKMTLFCPKIS